MYKFCESQRQGCEYMKQDSQVKKSLHMETLCMLEMNSDKDNTSNISNIK